MEASAIIHLQKRVVTVFCHFLLVLIVVEHKGMILLLKHVVTVFLIPLVPLVVFVVEQSLTDQLLKYAATEELKGDLDVNSFKLTHYKLTSF